MAARSQGTRARRVEGKEVSLEESASSRPRSSRTSSTRRCAAELNAARAGTRGGKSRGLVAGGRSKPWRQKGTGRARAGTTRAPHWTGGGVAFPPVMRSFEVKVNRKARRAALRGALSSHAANGTLALLDGAAFETPSTRDGRGAPRGLGRAPDARRRDRGRGGPREVLPQPREGARDRPVRARGRVHRLGPLGSRHRGRAAARARAGGRGSSGEEAAE